MAQNTHSTTPDDVRGKNERFGWWSRALAALEAANPLRPGQLAGLRSTGLTLEFAEPWAARVRPDGSVEHRLDPSLAGLARVVPCERPAATEPGDRPEASP